MNPSVETLNFHHLRYFWCVVVEGGVLPASRRLRVSHPTVSAQLRELEEQLGVPLFDRRGRRLELTEAGRSAFAYAERIFTTGRDLIDAMQSGRSWARLRVGVTDDIPKLFVRQLLSPVLTDDADRPRLVVEEERHQTLLGRLAVRELDVVLSDTPTPPSFRVEAVDHLLGSTGLSVLAVPPLAKRLRAGFPGSLDGAPLLAPLGESGLGQVLSGWLRRAGIAPQIVAEIADFALLKTLAGDGLGAVAVPRVAEPGAIAQYGVELVGRVEELEVVYFAATVGQLETEGYVAKIVEHGRALLEADARSRAR